MSGMSEVPIEKKLVGKCECGHVAAAHGSNGYICCVSSCNCKKFKGVNTYASK